MFNRRFVTVFVCILLCTPAGPFAFAQSKNSPVDKFRQLEEILPTPNDQRIASGARDQQVSFSVAWDNKIVDAGKTRARGGLEYCPKEVNYICRSRNERDSKFRLPADIRNPHFHKFHLSVTQIEYNPKEQTAEITIRVFADDLETALSQHAQRPIKIDPAKANKDKQLGETVIAYLRDQFQFKTSARRPVKLDWVGLEWKTDMFWLYVKGKLPEGLEGTQLRNKVFQELYEDQVNIVNSKIDGKQIGLMFDVKDEFKLITAYPPAKK